MCSGAAPPYLTVTPRCQPRNPITDTPILNERKETPRLHWGVTHSLHTSKTGSSGQTDSQIKKSVVATVFAEFVLVLVA